MASLRDVLEQQKKIKAGVEKAVADAKLPPAAPVSAPTKLAEGKPGGKPWSQRFQAAKPAQPETPAQSQVQAPPQIPAQTAVPQPEPPLDDASAKGQAELRQNLAYLANNIEQKDLVGQVVRTIAVQLRDNPQYFTTMPEAERNQSVNLLVRGLKKSHMVQARKVTEKVEKKSVKTEAALELEKMMKDIGVDFNIG